jgi:hypothetical protein
MMFRRARTLGVFLALLALSGLLCSQAEALGTEHSDLLDKHCCSACHAGHAPGVVQAVAFYFPVPSVQISWYAPEESAFPLPERIALAGPARAPPA